MASNDYSFQFKDVRLTRLNFSINRDFVPGPEIPIDMNLELEHVTIEDQNLLRLFVRLVIAGDNNPMGIDVELGSLFHFPDGFPSKEELSKIAEINCAAIVFPFVREIVAETTRRSGLAPLLLNPVNFVDFYKNNHADM